jgi:hypothetical protein
VSATNPWPALLLWIAAAVGVPLVFLAIGVAFYWALAGFVSGGRSKQS